MKRAAWPASLSVLILLIVAPPAGANMGSPLVMSGIILLLYGNLLIGGIEGAWISWRNGNGFFRSVLWLIGANYFSACVGLILLLPPIDATLTRSLGVAWFLSAGRIPLSAFVLSLFLVCFLASILLEFPFVWMAIGKGEGRLRRTGKAAFTANLITYALLIPLAMLQSSTTLRRNYRFDPTLPSRVERPLSVFVLDSSSNSLEEIRLPEGTRVRHGSLPDSPAKWMDRHLVLFSDETEPAWDLTLVVGVWASRATISYHTFTLIDSFRPKKGESWETAPIAYSRSEQLRHRNMTHYAPTLAADTSWRIRSEGPMIAMRFESGRERAVEFRHLTLELPGAILPPHSPAFIESHRIVFQIGQEVGLLDLEEKTIAILGPGEKPFPIPR